MITDCFRLNELLLQSCAFLRKTYLWLWVSSLLKPNLVR